MKYNIGDKVIISPSKNPKWWYKKIIVEIIDITTDNIKVKWKDGSIGYVKPDWHIDKVI